MLGWGVLYIIAAILIAIWPARVAKRKGHSFWLWLLISLFFWFIALFVVYFGLEDNTKTAKDKADEEAVDKILEKQEKAG